MLVAARQLVEKRGFAAILITHKGKGQFLCLGRTMRLGWVVVSGAVLSQAGVLNGQLPVFFLSISIFQGEWRVGVYLYFLCIRQSKRQFVSMNTQLHRVAHRCKLLQHHLGTRDYSHVQEMLS